MVVADDAGEFPGAIFELPEMDEAGRAGPAVCFGMEKAVDSHFKRAVALHGIDPERAGNKHAAEIGAADVFPDGIQPALFAERHSTAIVEELDMIVDQACQIFKLAAIDGAEKLSVERRPGLVEFSLRFDNLKRRDALSARSGDRHSEHHQQKQQHLARIDQAGHETPFRSKLPDYFEVRRLLMERSTA